MPAMQSPPDLITALQRQKTLLESELVSTTLNIDRLTATRDAGVRGIDKDGVASLYHTIARNLTTAVRPALLPNPSISRI